jgi:hypothetical protein
MSETTTIRLKGPADLLTSLPYQLGYHPKDSIVVVCMNNGRVGLVQRLDLPPIEHVVDALASMLEPMMRQRPCTLAWPAGWPTESPGSARRCL